MLPVFGFTVGSFIKDLTCEPSGCQCSDYEHGGIQGRDTVWSGKDIHMFW
jgi:CelD/BcsL family acetyltransferase involved in cellulose biosynthesis